MLGRLKRALTKRKRHELSSWTTLTVIFPLLTGGCVVVVSRGVCTAVEDESAGGAVAEMRATSPSRKREERAFSSGGVNRSWRISCADCGVVQRVGRELGHLVIVSWENG